MTNPKLTPRNLSAQSDRYLRQAVGNPATTSLDSAVANCFPGLEFDVRTLDNRFFPGLVFQFVQPPLYPISGAVPNQQGARLLYVDYLLDPMLPETSQEDWVQDLLDQYRGTLAKTFITGRWYLDWIEQGGTHLSMTDLTGSYHEGFLVWRLVRGLEVGSVTICLARRDLPGIAPVILKGFRRHYLDQAGIYDEAYRPGEFTQAMCNPWHHDFRDCACHYWASNHPDVVIRDPDSTANLPNGTPEDPNVAVTYVDWLRRREPSGNVAAANTIAANRPYQIDHYEINQNWESLPFVLEGREIEGPYIATNTKSSLPYSTNKELIDALQYELGPMELILAVQYLYALFSLKLPGEIEDNVSDALAGDLAAVRQKLLLIAVGEMTHLRWVNQLLWEIDRHGLGPKGWEYRPVVELAQSPSKIKDLATTLSPLTPDTLNSFINIERPYGDLARAYERCLATLKKDEFPPHLYEIAARIDDDGTGHYQHFRNIKHILENYAGSVGHTPYLRTIALTNGPETDGALLIFNNLRERIAAAYALEAKGSVAAAEAEIKKARTLMRDLQEMAEALAANGFGIPFLP